MRAHLGDSHNFGRRVSLAGERIAKPRTLLWEWLILSAKSPLRTTLAWAAQSDGKDDGLGAFDFLPDLAFRWPHALHSGEVERVVLEPLGRMTRRERRDLAEITGRAVALFAWLGVADLHWENLVLGRAKDGHIVFAPLDVEMILADLALPTETKLLPDADPEYAAICRHAAGVRRVLPYLGKPVDPDDLVAMAGAYRATLELLDRHARSIAAIFTGLRGLDGAPIRVCLRGTDEYLSGAPNWPPLLDAEIEQLARGDVPYFFRLYGKPGIRYYVEPTLQKLGRLPSRGDVPKLDPILSLSRGLRSKRRAQLREEGLFTVLGAFDHPSFRGLHENDALSVTFGAKSIVVRPRDGDELEVRRDLGAFVGSVYLGCRCGEVRTVFVPDVTRCTLSRQREHV